MNSAYRRSRLPEGFDTTIEMLDSAAETWPDRPFLDLGGRKVTFAAFKARVDRVALDLRERGVQPGDTICALLETGLASLVFWFAANRIGAIYVPLNTGLRGELLVNQIDDSRCRVVVADAPHAARVLDTRGSFARAETLLFVGDEHAPPPFDPIEVEDERPLQGAPAWTVPTPASPSMILYTSGTTGPSKGCLSSHAYVTAIGRKTAHRVNMNADDVSYSTLPLFHIFGMCGVVLACLSRGATVALRPRFSVRGFWADVAATGSTIVNAVGSMIPLIGNSPDSPEQAASFGQIRVALGIPFSLADMDLWKRRFGVQWVGNMGYGMTEAGMITEVDPSSDPRTAGSGRAVDFDVRILGPDGSECAPGEVGEIVARPLCPGLMFDGYWGKPAETLEVLRGMWLHTGDLGRLDEEGNLTFVDRMKDYMRSGGENVSSYELENILRKHPEIADVAAYGVQSDLAEDEIKLSVVLMEGATLREEALFTWCVERLPRHYVPHQIEFHDDLPRSPTGKILKYELKAAHTSGRSWSRRAAGMVVPR